MDTVVKRNVKKLRGRKKNTFIKKHRVYIKGLINRFMESESAGAYVGRVAIAVIGLAGILAIGAVAPNIFSAFRHYDKPCPYNEKQVRKSLYYLRKKRLVRFIKKLDGTYAVKITHLGRTKLAEFAIENMKINRQKQWDGKWRIAIFDIPERFRAARGSLRRKLKELGLFQLQLSVFAYPQDVTDEILFIAAFFEVEEFVEILTVESMLDDSVLRKHFSV